LFYFLACELCVYRIIKITPPPISLPINTNAIVQSAYFDRQPTCVNVQVSSYINCEYSYLYFVFTLQYSFQNTYFHCARRSGFDSRVQNSRSLYQGVQIQPKPSTPKPPIGLVMVCSTAGLIYRQKSYPKHLCLSIAEIKGAYSLTDLSRLESSRIDSDRIESGLKSSGRVYVAYLKWLLLELCTQHPSSVDSKHRRLAES
jgi:hypothetical protein